MAKCKGCGEGGLLFHGGCKLCEACLRKAHDEYLKRLEARDKILSSPLSEEELKLRKKLMHTILEVLDDMALEGVKCFIRFLQEWVKLCESGEKHEIS